MAYVAEVFGCTDHQITTMQTMSGWVLSPHAQDRSLTATLVAHGDSVGKTATAAITRWNREVWEAVTFSGGRALSLPELRTEFEDAATRNVVR